MTVGAASCARVLFAGGTPFGSQTRRVLRGSFLGQMGDVAHRHGVRDLQSLCLAALLVGSGCGGSGGAEETLGLSGAVGSEGAGEGTADSAVSMTTVSTGATDDVASLTGSGPVSSSGPDGGGQTTTSADATAGTDETEGIAEGWLYTEGNRIYTANGDVWHARGANIHDTRSCNACAYGDPSPGEVIRRVDELVDVWGANFVRMDLESYASADGRVGWASVLDDPQYVQDIRTIVDHIGTKSGTHVLLTLWVDPGHSEMGWPTATTIEEWRLLATEFANDAHVLFGVVNEPQSNFDGALDPQVWTAMDDTVAAIREVEMQQGTPAHIVTVQGTGGWARRLDYYVDHPIAAGGGENVAYEVHVYNPASDFDMLFVEPSATLPVVIGEFGDEDAETLMTQAEANEIPYLAWTFHMRCPPNLLVDNSGGGCGEGMPLSPTPFGQLLKSRLALPY